MSDIVRKKFQLAFGYDVKGEPCLDIDLDPFATDADKRAILEMSRSIPGMVDGYLAGRTDLAGSLSPMLYGSRETTREFVIQLALPGHRG